MPPFNPNPPDVGVTSIIISYPHSEHLPLKVMVDFSGLSSNNFLRSLYPIIIIFLITFRLIEYALLKAMKLLKTNTPH